MINANDKISNKFPDNFLWGSATSPTQVEGETVNEWQGFHAADGSTPDQGGDQWKKFEHDAAFISRMNLNSHRFGLDWGRLQSGPYQPLNQKAVIRYLEMLDILKERGIEPFITLFHFACPQWLASIGGWLCPRTPAFFADFVQKLLAAGFKSKYWVTINEPGVYMTMAYLMGIFPPKKHLKLWQARRVLNFLAEGHLLAYRIIKARQPEAMVGIAKHFKRAIPHRIWHPIDLLNSLAVHYIFCRRILEMFVFYDGDKISDFVGLNFYGRLRVKGFRDISPISGDPTGILQKAGAICDDMWEQDAGWLPDCVADIYNRTGLPVYITECGFATADENLRTRLLHEHLHAVLAAINQGLDIRGFFYWSLIDNFEWAEGLRKRFGLVGIDFNSPDWRRELRPAGKVFSRIAVSGQLPPYSSVCCVE